MKKDENDKFEKIRENKRAKTLEEKEDLILKEKSKEENTFVMTLTAIFGKVLRNYHFTPPISFLGCHLIILRGWFWEK